MPKSASRVGSYYRLKTKKWLEAKGWTVATLERHQRIFDEKKNKIFFIKRDIFGSDMMAMNGEQMIFVNSVFGKSNIASHIKEFAKYPFPKYIEKWVVVWERGDREPDIIGGN